MAAGSGGLALIIGRPTDNGVGVVEASTVAGLTCPALGVELSVGPLNDSYSSSSTTTSNYSISTVPLPAGKHLARKLHPRPLGASVHRDDHVVATLVSQCMELT